MGYMFSRQTKAELVEELKRDNPLITEWSLNGNELWGLYPISTNQPSDLMIVLFLLASHGDEYGYQVMDESAQPYYYTCPLKFLNKAVELSPEWRTNVRAYHNAKSERARTLKRIKVGDTIALKNTSLKSVQVIGLKPLMGIDVKTNRTYRIPSRFIA